MFLQWTDFISRISLEKWRLWWQTVDLICCEKCQCITFFLKLQLNSHKFIQIGHVVRADYFVPSTCDITTNCSINLFDFKFDLTECPERALCLPFWSSLIHIKNQISYYDCRKYLVKSQRYTNLAISQSFWLNCGMYDMVFTVCIYSVQCVCRHCKSV